MCLDNNWHFFVLFTKFYCVFSHSIYTVFIYYYWVLFPTVLFPTFTVNVSPSINLKQPLKAVMVGKSYFMPEQGLPHSKKWKSVFANCIHRETTGENVGKLLTLIIN